MSKLADAIRRIQRVEAAPMGFGASRPVPKPTMLVGVIGDGGALDAARGAAPDLLVLDARGKELSTADAAKARAANSEAILGAWTTLSNGARAKELKDAGIDFLIFDPDETPAAALLHDDLGYVLVPPEEPAELFLRSLEPLSLEAIFLSRVPSPLTVSRQIELGRIGMLTHKPLVAQVEAGAAKEDLECLRAAGVAVLLVGSAGEVAALKETVAALPPRRQKRDDRPVVSLPRGAAPAENDDDDDE